MPYNPGIHHRRSIRLKGYDYSQEGLYFITICVQDRECLFGEIVVGAPLRGRPESEIHGCPESEIHGRPESEIHGCPNSESDINECKRMILNDAGKMVERWYRELENKYPDKRCHEMVIMPNHFHCIIENLGGDLHLDAHAGAPKCGRTIINENGNPNDIECVHHDDEKYGMHNKKYNVTIGNLVDWFKTMTTNEYIRGVKQYGWKRFDGKLWQRNYYEHVIRSSEEYERIADYITDNPANWQG